MGKPFIVYPESSSYLSELKTSRKESLMEIISESVHNPKSEKFRLLKELAKYLWLTDQIEDRGRSRSRDKGIEKEENYWEKAPTLRGVSTPLKKSKSMHNLVNIFDTTTIEKPQIRKQTPKRVLVFSNFPPSTGVTSVLAQVCCGPLEKVVATSTSIELHYFFSEHAIAFYNYVNQTGLFRVNGTHLQLQWADNTNTDDALAPIPKLLLKEVTIGSARRILIFSKMVPHKKLKDRSRMYYPSAKTHLSKDLDIADVKADFSQFGQIIEFGSVISSKLCFSINFADVRSAIAAKKEVETLGSMLNTKYQGWSLWYGRDSTDKPCYVL